MGLIMMSKEYPNPLNDTQQPVSTPELLAIRGYAKDEDLTFMKYSWNYSLKKPSSVPK